jgi:peptidoglycan biosynthesis protein MviN/MurJ (putative lipid II flippase)
VSRGVIFGVDRQRSLVIVGTFAAVVNVALDILLIHLFDATGAALANAGAQSAAAIAYAVVARRSTGAVDWAPGALARNAVAACAAGAAAWAATAVLPGVAGTLSGVALFAAVFCVLGVMLRIMPTNDGPWLESVLAARLPRRSRLVARRMIAAASRA